MSTNRQCFLALTTGVIFAIAGFFFAGCSSADAVSIPALPAWPVESPATPISGHDVADAVRRIRPWVPVYTADAKYVPVSHEWLEDYLLWTWRAAKAAGFAYVEESGDCDDFALGFYFFASRAAAKARVKAAPLVARIIVETPAGRHELAAVYTDRGIFVVEPQPDAVQRIIPLAEYRQRIVSVVLGDFNPG